MKFIIATPVFNGMPALRRCVGSIRGQISDGPLNALNVETPDGSLNENPTLTCNGLNEGGARLNATVPVAVHHIIQDGGSSDGTREFLEKLAGNDSFQIIVDKESRSTHQLINYQLTFASEADNGMYDAINRAWARGLGPPVKSEQLTVKSEKSATSNNSPASVATDNLHPQIESEGLGSFTTHNSPETIVSWLNSDEQYLPGTLQKVAQYFKTHPEVDAVFGNTIITDANGAPYAARREIPLRKMYVANGFLYALSCSTFYRRNLWDRGLLKLDTQYRYSADADLVLRLLSAGVRFGHVDDFFALFGVEEGQNLSFRPEMKVEGDAIKRKHGAFAWAPARKAVMACRYAERLVRGCYRPVPVEYAYALNEQPEYSQYKHPALSFRFTYAGFSKEQA